MTSLMFVTLKGVFRDRVFHGILMTAVLFLFIPSVASLSLRQVTELSTTLALSLISFILLLLAVFLGGTCFWKDMERRYSFSVLGLPMKRSSYLLGKFCGTALFLFLVALLLLVVTLAVVFYASGIYPSTRPIAWGYIGLAVCYDALKYTILIAFAFLFSTVSTSFFLPIFGTVSLFLVGSATQEAYDFILTPTGQQLPGVVKAVAKGLYYILPNFSAFDLKINAIYGIKVVGYGSFLTLAYFLVYTAMVLFLATVIFSRKELK